MRLTHRSPRAKGDFHRSSHCGSAKLNLGLEFYPLYPSAPDHLPCGVRGYLPIALFRVPHRRVISVPLTLASLTSVPASPAFYFALPEGEVRLMRSM
ncbi:hypothetical protein BDR06DRAFT_956709 [Suillus hirtellus]|nr:hypothetical protein BDR06DRAFT_956709 [Suillus hirtellus]